MQIGINYSDRINEIEGLLYGPKPLRTEAFRVTDYDSDDFPKYKMSIGHPKYRIENTRTIAHQIEFCHENDDWTIFKDAESNKTQQAQHDILREMIGEEGLLKRFQEGATQSNAIVLTRDGFVISGNRRLCCWRELFESNPKKYNHYSEIEVCILESPNKSPEIEKFEALQETDTSIQSKFGWFQVVMKFAQILQGYADDVEAGYKRVISLYQNSNYLKKKSEKGKIDEINRWIDISKHARAMMEKDALSLDFVLKNQLAFEAWYDNQLDPDKCHVLDHDIYNKIVHDVLLVDPTKVNVRNKHHFIQAVSKFFNKIKDKYKDEKKIRLDENPEIKILEMLNENPVIENVSTVVDQIEMYKFNANNKEKRDIALKYIEKAQEYLKLGSDYFNEDSNIMGMNERLRQIDIMVKRITSVLKNNKK